MPANPRISSTSMAIVFGHIHKAGGTVPKDTHAAHEALVSLAEKVRDRGRSQVGSDVPGAVLAAIAADRDPATDPEVQRQVTLYQIATMDYGIHVAVDKQVGAFLDEHTPKLLAAFAKPFDTAAATITRALVELDGLDLDDARKVLARGPAAAKTWGEAQEAVATIDQGVKAWKMLAGAGAPCPITKGTRLLLIADPTPATWFDDQLDQTGDDLTPWDAARRGYPLSWATPTTYAERLAAIRTEQARRAGAAETARHDAFTQPLRHNRSATLA